MLQLGFSFLSQERWSSKRMICPLVKQPLCLEEVYSMDSWKSNLKSRSKGSSQHDALHVVSNNNVGCIHVMAKLRLECPFTKRFRYSDTPLSEPNNQFIATKRNSCPLSSPSSFRSIFDLPMSIRIMKTVSTKLTS